MHSSLLCLATVRYTLQIVGILLKDRIKQEFSACRVVSDKHQFIHFSQLYFLLGTHTTMHTSLLHHPHDDA